VRNHDEKVKDMSRSVLPSTARAGARYFRRQVHKRQRALELNGLTEYRKSAKTDSARRDSAKADGVAADLDGAYRGDIATVVRERRFHDKDAPLVRWARATVAADPALRSAPLEEQIAYFARLMPPTLIGRHAVQHIQSALEEPHARTHCAPKSAPDRGARVAETERLVRQILAAGLHGTLNAQLRAAASRQSYTGAGAVPFPRRLLLGRHDVEAFASELGRVPRARAVIAAVAAITQSR
jgi:hypothetical protein